MTTRIKNIDAIKANLKSRVKEFKFNATESTAAAKTIQNELRANLRDGKLGDSKDFPKLKTETITRRKRLATVNKTSKYFNAAVSNATLTGETIRKIFAKSAIGKIVIFGKGKHAKYKGVKGKPIKGSDASIQDIIQGFADRGVKLLYVPQSAKTKIKKQFIRFLRRKR